MASAEEFVSLKEKPTKIYLVQDNQGEERKLIVTGSAAIRKVDNLAENTVYTFRFISRTNEADWAYVFGGSSMIRNRP
jgi:hypothetical protein